jgi:hypothetical protein
VFSNAGQMTFGAGSDFQVGGALAIYALSNAMISDGDTFTVLTSSGILGDFASISDNSAFINFTWSIYDGKDVILTAPFFYICKQNQFLIGYVSALSTSISARKL